MYRVCGRYQLRDIFYVPCFIFFIIRVVAKLLGCAQFAACSRAACRHFLDWLNPSDVVNDDGTADDDDDDDGDG